MKEGNECVHKKSRRKGNQFRRKGNARPPLKKAPRNAYVEEVTATVYRLNHSSSPLQGPLCPPRYTRSRDAALRKSLYKEHLLVAMFLPHSRSEGQIP